MSERPSYACAEAGRRHGNKTANALARAYLLLPFPVIPGYSPFQHLSFIAELPVKN